MKTSDNNALAMPAFNAIKQKPFGLMISPNAHYQQLQDFPPELLFELVKKHQLVIWRGFPELSKQQYHDYAKSLGSLLSWDFGDIMEMKAHAQPKNYLFTHDNVPFHWDGAFHTEPQCLLFHCLQAPSRQAGGETLFCHTQKLYADSHDDEKKLWDTLSLTLKTEKLAHYGGEVHSPLVQSHPWTDKKILRFAEPVVGEAVLNPVEVNIDDDSDNHDLIKALASRCYDDKYCLAHQWQDGDYLIADNFALIHGRHAFKQHSPRHLRRIQIKEFHHDK